MKILKRISIVVLGLILITVGCVFYAFKIEPYIVRVNHFTLNEEEMGTEEIKIAQISDLHIKEDFTYKNLDKVVKKINDQEPDIVVFTGDLYDNYAKYNDDETIILKLQKIEAKYAKIAIWGNRDYGGGAGREFANIMESSDFILLENDHQYITVEDEKEILFTGLDDSLLGQPFMPESGRTEEVSYEILLIHEPDIIEEYMDESYDIVLSGHSHGGQINIPFLPFVNEIAIEATSLSSKYSGGMYDFEEESQQKLYVNTGIGTTHISARFGVVPEIALFHIYI